MTTLSQTFTPSPLVAQMLVALTEYEGMFARCARNEASPCDRTRALAQAGVTLYGARIAAIRAALPDDGLDGRKSGMAKGARAFNVAAGVKALRACLEEHGEMEEAMSERALLADDAADYARAMGLKETHASRIAEIRAALDA